MVMPSIAVTERNQKCFLTIVKVRIVSFNANGANTIQAIVQRQKARPTGGICPLTPLAITMFTDHKKVAIKANKTPFV